MSHKLFSLYVIVAAVILWIVASVTHSHDVALICKMFANQAVMLGTVTAFGNLYISRKDTSYEVWTKIYESSVGLAVLHGCLAIASAICAVGTLVIFAGE